MLIIDGKIWFDIDEVINENCYPSDNRYSSLLIYEPKKVNIKYKFLDELEDDNFNCFSYFNDKYKKYVDEKHISIYTTERMSGYSDVKMMIESFENRTISNEKELCKLLGIIYYSDEECCLITLSNGWFPMSARI